MGALDIPALRPFNKTSSSGFPRKIRIFSLARLHIQAVNKQKEPCYLAASSRG